MDYSNLTLMTDLYELTMMNGYYSLGSMKRTMVFDLFFRENPGLGGKGGYSIAAGLAQVIDYINNLKFTKEDIEYLRGFKIFNDDFLKYIENLRFTGDIYAVPEGTVIFPQEPFLRVKASVIEAQLIESALLNIINHQSLIATKATRVVQACNGDAVMEFGLRRAQGPDAGIYGSRAAVIGGCAGTSNVLAGKMFNLPVMGTHAHSWVMSFADELTAFREYARLYPDKCMLLVDTYNTLKSGVPNAIKVFQEMKEAGLPLDNIGIRLDSGDLAYLSKKSLAMLKSAGFGHAKICASGDLDEIIISDLKIQGAAINVWGVGTRLITSKDCPAFGGVYKMAAEIDESTGIIPKIKISENIWKVTNPGIKKIFRLYDKNAGKISADLIALDDEELDETKDLTIFDPVATWKKMTLEAGMYTVRDLLIPIFKDGKQVYETPSVMAIRDYCKTERDTLWDEYKRLINPQIMYVDLSQKLYDLKNSMINELRAKR